MLHVLLDSLHACLRAHAHCCQERCSALELRGRVRVALDGLNATLTGAPANLQVRDVFAVSSARVVIVVIVLLSGLHARMQS